MSDSLNLNDWFSPSQNNTEVKADNDGVFHLSFSSDKKQPTAASEGAFSPLKPDVQPSEPPKPTSSLNFAAQAAERPSSPIYPWGAQSSPQTANYAQSDAQQPRAAYEAPSVNVSAPQASVSDSSAIQAKQGYEAPSINMSASSSVSSAATMGAATTNGSAATAFALKPETVAHPSSVPSYVEKPKQVVTPSYSDIRESYESDASAPAVSSKNQIYQAPSMSVSSGSAYTQPTMTVTPSASIQPIVSVQQTSVQPEEVKNFFTPVAPKSEPQFVDCNIVVTKPKAEKKVKTKAVKEKKVVNMDEKREKATAKRLKPVGFFKMFFTQILFLIPVIGWLSMTVCAINPKCNKNVRSLAITSLIWSLVVYGAIGLFAWYGGIGYILSFLEKTFNVVIAF